MKTVIVLSALLLLTSACASNPPGPPGGLALEIMAELDAGRSAQADELFERVATDRSYTEEIYPVLYARAQERYEAGDFADAATLLRFLARHYDRGKAVREALLYALFLDRATTPGPRPELTAEIEGVLRDLRTREARTPWLELVAAQQAIDQDRLPEARQAFERFVTSDGPTLVPELALYVENVSRYLQSH